MGKEKEQVNPEKLFRERKGNHEVFFNEVAKEYFAVSIDTSLPTGKFADIDNLYAEIATVDEKNRKAAELENQKGICANCTKYAGCTHRELIGCTEAEVEANAGNPFLNF